MVQFHWLLRDQDGRVCQHCDAKKLVLASARPSIALGASDAHRTGALQIANGHRRSPSGCSLSAGRGGGRWRRVVGGRREHDHAALRRKRLDCQRRGRGGRRHLLNVWRMGGCLRPLFSAVGVMTLKIQNIKISKSAGVVGEGWSAKVRRRGGGRSYAREDWSVAGAVPGYRVPGSKQLEILHPVEMPFTVTSFTWAARSVVHALSFGVSGFHLLIFLFNEPGIKS
ncbi:hypothetical protein T492DRAFT_7388 [Pavlovales sp. CCMP2436]|nr:hypothetical protein T492DRAFT_7388 [Pavlovales sp. CCMP2436]